MTSTRRLAAILAADMVGYSRLMGANEEGTLARLQALRGEVIDPAVAKSNGRIVKSTGDGILAEFPSAVEAVRRALDMQTEMCRHEEVRQPEPRIAARSSTAFMIVFPRAVTPIGSVIMPAAWHGGGASCRC
jgi:class 3 adenylate cyclase